MTKSRVTERNMGRHKSNKELESWSGLRTDRKKESDREREMESLTRQNVTLAEAIKFKRQSYSLQSQIHTHIVLLLHTTQTHTHAPPDNNITQLKILTVFYWFHQ